MPTAKPRRLNYGNQMLHLADNEQPAAFALSKELDADRIKTPKKRTLDASKESRIARRSRRSAAEEAAYEAEGPLYEAGMAD
ncbi:hypothetical protein ANTPLA_LOCUS2984 [Anthophora plagiata]